MRLISIVFSMLISSALIAQTQVDITIILEDDRSSVQFLSLVQDEIDALMATQYSVQYDVVNADQTDEPIQQIIDHALKDDSDILITLGFRVSNALSQTGAYTKPCIAGITLDRIEQETTGIENFTIIQSPFSISEDLATFQSIDSFDHLGVFIQSQMADVLEPYFSQFADGFELSLLPISNNPDSDLDNIYEGIDAIYLLPNLYDKDSDHQKLIDGFNERGISSFSLIGRNDVERGVLAGIAPSDYISVYARRLALNVMKITEGVNARDLPVHISSMDNDFVINHSTMEQIDIYPPFEVLNQASFVDISSSSGKSYTLQSAIAEALGNNLTFIASSLGIDIQQQEVGIARANLLPTLDASSSIVTIDQSSADQLAALNQSTPQTHWSGNLGLSQLIFSQPAWANKAIQKALLESEKAGILSQQLDLVLEVCTAYIRILQAQANVEIQNTNVGTTFKNLNIAKSKVNIGTASNADVYGFESQLAVNKTTLNDALTTLEQAKINFNQLLNRPLNNEFTLTGFGLDEKIIFVQEERLQERINNLYDLREFSDFLIEYATAFTPEIDQINWNIKAQEHSLDLHKKSRYMPLVAAQVGLDQTFNRLGTRTPDDVLESFGIDPYQPTWNAGISASIPLFEGNLKLRNIEKNRIALDQLTLTKESIELSLATNIRVSLENLGNSYNDIQLTLEAEQASIKYLDVVQDLYQEGAFNIVALLDAQVNAVSAQLSAVSSRYQFILDAITLERLFNKIYIISTSQERDQFIQEYFSYLINKNDEN